jgi:ribonuclease VapC
VIDSRSALIALPRDEPEKDRLINAIVDSGRPRISSILQRQMIMEWRWGERGERDSLIDEVDIEIVPVDHDQAKAARDGFRRYGEGFHKAAPNFSEGFPDALAKTLDLPLLSKGDDFALTDIKRAL